MITTFLNNPLTPYFKLKDLRVYASTEWLAENKKKYRQVFDRFETSYIYVELSFYNKYFDIDDWDAEIVLKCFANRRNNREVCELPLQRKISKNEPIYYVREGWGAKKEGSFWKKGSYYWEAYINGEKIAEKPFFVEDSGRPVPERGPLLELASIRLYEGPYDDVDYAARNYFKAFQSEETRYIYCEVDLRNHYPARQWQCEVFIKFFNNARELKGQVVRLMQVDRTEDAIMITGGWGSNVKGSWRKEVYTAEVVFMDKFLGSVEFEVGDVFDEGYPEVNYSLSHQLQAPSSSTFSDAPPMVQEEESFDNLANKFDKMIGLNSIKRKIREHAQYLQFLQIRREKGFSESDYINLHTLYIGNPGTGKTTVAKMLGLLYKKMGFLTSGHVVEVDRSNLVGEYIGQTAPKMKEAIEKARGGVLFIDEAYALARGNDDSKDFGREAIEILLKEMSDGVHNFVVIAAGYPKEMKTFLDSNPGLKSRFKHTFEFPDYLPQELNQIAQFSAQEQGVTLHDKAVVALDKLIVNAYRERDRTFGNARFVHDLIEQAKINLGLRVMSLPNPKDLEDHILSEIMPSDIEKIHLKAAKGEPNIPIDEVLLDDSLNELHGLIGMKNVKAQISELVKLVRFHRETERGVLNKFFLHTVFVGNPGTGKTTVARILTKIYKALGILERGHTVETDRQGLVAGYHGQTAIKTAEKIDEAKGGVLFIDEAYALTSSHHGGNDFGSEVIQTLLKRMEDQRGEFFVFVAGYPDQMEGFLKANPGLRSRFDKVLKFEDYNSSELSEIAMQMIREENLSITPEAKEHLQRYLSFQYEYRDKYFGNARSVRNIISEIVKNQNLRLASLLKEERDMEMTAIVILDDVAILKLDKDAENLSNKKSIGFQRHKHDGGDNVSDSAMSE